MTYFKSLWLNEYQQAVVATAAPVCSAPFFGQSCLCPRLCDWMTVKCVHIYGALKAACPRLHNWRKFMRVQFGGGMQVLSKVDTERFVAAAHLLLEPKGVFFGSCGGAQEAGADPLRLSPA